MTSELPILSREMSQDPAEELAKRQWVDCAQVRLGTLTEAVAALRGLLASCYGATVEQREAIAADVLGASAAMTQWLDTSSAPKGLRKAEGELGATAGVYRNAAVAFGSLAQAGPDQHAARYAACEKLLDQGNHHTEVFISILRRKGLLDSA